LFAPFLAAALFIWWWNYSGSLLPLTKTTLSTDGKFELAAALPVPRTEASGVAHGKHFYVAGGLGAWGQTLTSFLAYSSESQRWEELPPVPAQLNHAAIVATSDRIFLIGGFGPLGIRLRGFMFARWDPKDTVFIYDPKNKTWQSGPAMPEARGAGGATVAGDAIWYAGGIGPDLAVSADLFRLDLKTMRWEKKRPMLTARDHLRVESVGGAVFTISGRKDDLRHNYNATERYDIATDTWSSMAPIPTPRGGLSSAVLNGYIYTFGGESVWSCFDLVERYDPVLNEWQTLTGLPEKRHGILAGVIDGKIHLVSGGRHPRLSISGIHRVFTPPARAE